MSRFWKAGQEGKEDTPKDTNLELKDRITEKSPRRKG